MTVYVISNVRPKPGEALDQYRRLAAESIERHGGRYLVRGGDPVAVEGAWRDAAVVVAFPDMDAAQRWYRSSDYAEALRWRDAALDRDLVFVEGVEP